MWTQTHQPMRKLQALLRALTSSTLRLVSSEQKGNVSPKWKQAVLAQGTRMNSAPHHNALTVSWMLTHFLCASETHTTSKEQITPRAFKAPRLKGTFQQLEKTLRVLKSHKEERVFWKQAWLIHPLKASHLWGRARGGGEGEGIKPQTRPGVAIFIPQVQQDTVGFCSATR